MCRASSFLLLQPHTLFPISDLMWEISYGECQTARLDDGKASGGNRSFSSRQAAQQLCCNPAEIFLVPQHLSIPSKAVLKHSKKNRSSHFHLGEERAYPKPCQSLKAQKWDKPNKNIRSCENTGLPKDFQTFTAAYGCFLLLSLGSSSGARHHHIELAATVRPALCNARRQAPCGAGTSARHRHSASPAAVKLWIVGQNEKNQQEIVSIYKLLIKALQKATSHVRYMKSF